jgi:hypothetical protein
VLADGTGLPDDSDPDLAALGPLIQDDLFHDKPKDLLALDHTRRILELTRFGGHLST